MGIRRSGAVFRKGHPPRYEGDTNLQLPMRNFQRPSESGFTSPWKLCILYGIFSGLNQETGACHYKGFKVKRKIDSGLSRRSVFSPSLDKIS
jgi:hypothetical protein